MTLNAWDAVPVTNCVCEVAPQLSIPRAAVSLDTMTSYASDAVRLSTSTVNWWTIVWVIRSTRSTSRMPTWVPGACLVLSRRGVAFLRLQGRLAATWREDLQRRSSRVPAYHWASVLQTPVIRALTRGAVNLGWPPPRVRTVRAVRSVVVRFRHRPLSSARRQLGHRAVDDADQ